MPASLVDPEIALDSRTDEGGAPPPVSDTDSGLSFSGAPRTPLGLFAALIALTLPLAFSPALDASVWAPKAALGLLIAGVGVPMLLRERSLAGLAAATFLALACGSTAISDSPGMSLGGLWNWGTGLALTAAAVGAWGIGRSLNGSDRRLLEIALTASTAFVAVVAIIQSQVDLSAFGVIPAFGRPTALQGNPVYLGGIVLIGIAIGARRAAEGGRRWLGLVFVCSVAGSVALGRVTLAVALVVAVLQIRVSWRKALAVLATVALGWAAGAGLVARSTLPGSAGDRIEGSASAVAIESYTVRQGLGPRMDTWLSARHAVRDHPLLGAGPGRFWAATIGHRPLSVTRYSPSIYYADPHNFVVEYTVTTGLLGVLALATWLLLAARKASGPLALVAFALGAVHLIQPQNAAVTPLALLCLGAAGARARVIPPALGRISNWGAAVGLAAATALAGAFIVGQLALRQAYLDFGVAQADRAYRFLPIWPEVAERRAIVAAGDLTFGATPNWAAARPFYREATRRDPRDPRVWINLGDFEQARQQADAAERAYEQALQIEPNSLKAFHGLWAVAHFRGDAKMTAYWKAKVESITNP
ncbi:MAG TPA: O-antigen ligase family protein [Acidimicrobiales bacterium]|nr:O-antigen ligase family protein [Acidimicrobiales bacterium]